MSPIMAMAFDPTSTLLATGSADSSVKIWDCTRNYYTHNFRGSNGVVQWVIVYMCDPSSILELYIVYLFGRLFLFICLFV